MLKKLSKIIFLVPVFLLFGCGDSAEVTMVKQGSLQSCQSVTIEKMVSSFMGSPKWESGKSDGGVEFVNISGDITLHDKPVRAVVQFSIDKNAGSFEFNAFEINEVPQNRLMAMALMQKMCDSAKSKHG